ncbi:hypothetical protein G6F57_022714 [Rhizopus arrhizus]|nr:hypothetical protein G6F57_022714 [Rhizopus arrhizus]
MGSIQCVVNDSLKTTLDFLMEFLEMKNVYDTARSTAIETVQQYREEGNNFHFDVLVKSPVVIIPTENNDCVIAHLGEIRAKNEFIDIDRRDTFEIHHDQSQST